MPSDFKNKIAFLYWGMQSFFLFLLLAVSLFSFSLFLSLLDLFSLSFVAY